MQLKEILTDRTEELNRIKAEHAETLKQCDEELAACRKRVEHLQHDLEKGIAERVNSVTTAVIDENAHLRREVSRLRAEIEKLMGGNGR